MSAVVQWCDWVKQIDQSMSAVGVALSDSAHSDTPQPITRRYSGTLIPCIIILYIILVICITWPGRCISVTLKGIIHLEFKTSMFFQGMQRLMSRFCFSVKWNAWRLVITIMFVAIQRLIIYDFLHRSVVSELEKIKRFNCILFLWGNVTLLVWKMIIESRSR